jgi:hypothetical protein
VGLFELAAFERGGFLLRLRGEHREVGLQEVDGRIERGSKRAEGLDAGAVALLDSLYRSQLNIGRIGEVLLGPVFHVAEDADVLGKLSVHGGVSPSP